MKQEGVEKAMNKQTKKEKLQLSGQVLPFWAAQQRNMSAHSHFPQTTFLNFMSHYGRQYRRSGPILKNDPLS